LLLLSLILTFNRRASCSSRFGRTEDYFGNNGNGGGNGSTNSGGNGSGYGGIDGLLRLTFY
jgi:hypothetical protein